MKKFALFAYNGETMCFVHVLLTAIEMNDRNYDVKIIMEGSATRLIKELADPNVTFANLYQKVKESNLIDCVCKACSNKMGSLNAAMEQELPICDELQGHPSMSRYIEDGYEIITF